MLGSSGVSYQPVPAPVLFDTDSDDNTSHLLSYQGSWLLRVARHFTAIQQAAASGVPCHNSERANQG